MGAHKHIEQCIGDWIGSRFRSAVEIGAGENFYTAEVLRDAGVRIFCTDIKPPAEAPCIPFFLDDIFAPDTSLYQGIEVIYSVRPGEEMIPPMIQLARKLDVDLLVYHLGFEGFERGGEIIECGVVIHCYHRCQNPSKRVF